MLIQTEEPYPREINSGKWGWRNQERCHEENLKAQIHNQRSLECPSQRQITYFMCGWRNALLEQMYTN